MSNYISNALKYYKNYKRVSKLRKKGAKDGDNVRILDFEFEYKD